MKVITIILTLFIFIGCFSKIAGTQNNVLVDSTKQAKNLNNTQTDEKTTPKVIKIDYYDIKNSLGLVTITQKGFSEGQSIEIYNQDGSIWYKTSLFNDGAVKSIEQNQDFRPFRYDLDDNFFYFNCVGQDAEYFQVIVNDETGLKKFVRKDSSHFKFESWEKYILDCFAVEFDIEKNPLREEINGKVIVREIPKELYFNAVEIKGEWLKVNLRDINTEKSYGFGWIRWKINDKIMINFLETA